MKNTETEAARLNSPSTTIKTIMDFSSVARQRGHLSLGWGMGATHLLFFHPCQKASEQFNLPCHPPPPPTWPAGQQTQAQPGRKLVPLQWESCSPPWPLSPDTSASTLILIFHTFT